MVRLLRRAGVRRLSAVVATHQSRDHQRGLREVLEQVPADLYVDGDGNPDPAFLAIAAQPRARGSAVSSHARVTCSVRPA